MTILTDATLNDHLGELAAFEPNGSPVVSLYLDMRPDQHGRDDFDGFVRKEFRARAKALPADSPELAPQAGRPSSPGARGDSAAAQRLERLRLLGRLKRRAKVKGLSARQLLEKRMAERRLRAERAKN